MSLCLCWDWMDERTGEKTAYRAAVSVCSLVHICGEKCEKCNQVSVNMLGKGKRKKFKKHKEEDKYRGSAWLRG